MAAVCVRARVCGPHMPITRITEPSRIRSATARIDPSGLWGKITVALIKLASLGVLPLTLHRKKAVINPHASRHRRFFSNKKPKAWSLFLCAVARTSFQKYPSGARVSHEHLLVGAFEGYVLPLGTVLEYSCTRAPRYWFVQILLKKT